MRVKTEDSRLKIEGLCISIDAYIVMHITNQSEKNKANPCRIRKKALILQSNPEQVLEFTRSKSTNPDPKP